MHDACRTKFEVEITDGTGSITATIFEKEVEDVFHMTATEFKTDAINVWYSDPIRR